jgi:hypothetical protein
MRRLPARWWQFVVTIERRTGQGPAGAIYAPATTHLSRITQSNTLTRDSDGAETVSSTQVLLPAGVPTVPDGSKVTLPTQFGGTTHAVKNTRTHYFDRSTVVAYRALELT